MNRIVFLKKKRHRTAGRIAAASAALLMVLSLLLPLTAFAKQEDWDTYIKDPNYTVVAENGSASYDTDTGKVVFNGGDPILIELYKKGQEDGDPVLYQEMNAKFSVPSSYVSTIPKDYESISFKPVSKDGGVVYHADSFEKIRRKNGIGHATGGYSGGMGTGAMEAGEAYASIHWSLDYDYVIRIVSEAVWPLEYTIRSGGEIMSSPKYLDAAMERRKDYVERGWDFGETTMSGRRTIFRVYEKEESNPNQGSVLLSGSIDYSQSISIGQTGGKTNNTNGRTVSYGSSKHSRDVSYAVIDELPTVPGYYAVILIDTSEGYDELLAVSGRVRNEASETRAAYFSLRDKVMESVPADIAATKMEFYWGKQKINDPVIQETVTDAKKETGEDDGSIIENIIVDGSKPDLTLPIGLAISLGGAVVAVGMKSLIEDQEEARERENWSYKMYINKTFGDELRPDEPPRYVYARIVEITPQGAERDRPDLTEKIRPFSGDNVLDVTDAGMVETGYRAAKVLVPQNCDRNEGEVSFQFVGKGGTYTRHVVFRIIVARIDFGQENLGLPAHLDKEVRLPFDVIGMPEEAEVTASFKAEKKGKPIYSVKLEQDKKRYWRWEAVIKDVLPDDKEEPGTTVPYALHIRAEAPAGAGEGGNILQEKLVVETDFPVIRIHMGLSLALESDAIGCFLKIKEGADAFRDSAHLAGWNVSAACASGLNPQTALITSGVSSMVDLTNTAADPMRSRALVQDDLEPCVTKGKLLLLRYNEEQQVIERVAVYPEPWNSGGLQPKRRTLENTGGGTEKVPPYCGVTVLQVETSRNAEQGAPDAVHQSTADALKICAFPTNEVDEHGARTIRICSTGAAMDPPTRMKAELGIRVKYKPKEDSPEEEYEVKKTVLLHSMPFRNFSTEEEKDEFYKWDKHVGEMLSSIETRIYNNYMYHLDSLHDMVHRMLTGYDRRFGYDYNQLNHVMDLWTGFLKGEKLGARGEAEKLTLADDLAAAYAFMQGMRDNTGLLGRIALGVCTAGYSETVFFAMDLGEKMKEAVFACKGGDDEFGFWDGVIMGVKEYEKQLAAEFLFSYGLKKVGQTTNAWINSLKKDTWGDYIDIGEWATGKYKDLINAIDDNLKQNCKPYQATAKALGLVNNYSNSSTKAALDSLRREAELNAAAEAKANAKIHGRKTTIAERRMGMGDELKTSAKWTSDLNKDLARENGWKDLRDLWKAQDALKKCRDSGGDYWKAKAEYKEAAKKVWLNKNALKELKNFEGVHSKELKIEFNRYRSEIKNRTAEKALDDIAAWTGKRREDLYVSSATSNSSLDELTGKTVPEDWDVTVTEVNFSDLKRRNSFAIDDPTVAKDILAKSKENIYLVIDQKVGEEALAKNLYKEVYGVEAASLDEALKAMKDLDVTYVQPIWTDGMTITPNPEAYADLAGMIDKSQIGRDLKALGLNRNSFAHKGKEWYKMADEFMAASVEAAAKAQTLAGEAKEALLKEAMRLRLKAYACNVEGTRQITKQVTKIAMPRNAYRVSQGMQDAFSANAREIHALAKKVGTEIGPDEFFHILRRDYGIDKYAYTEMMANCLV